MAEQQQNDRGGLDEIEGLTDLPKPIKVDLGDKDGGGDKGGDGPGKERQAGKEGDKPQPKEDENVAALRRDLAAERRRTQAAEARARDLEQQRQAAEAQSTEGQLRLITNSLDGAQKAMTRARDDYKAALSREDHDAAVEAQIALNDAQYQVNSLTRGKEEMERRAASEKEARERQPQRRQNDDPVEAMAANLSQKSGEWIRNNPDCVNDPRKNRQMIRAHEDAQDEGIKIDSPEYFAFIEKRLGIGHNDDEGGEQEQRQEGRQRPQQRRQASPDAPVSRGGNGDGRGSNSRSVTLTSAQRQFCDDSGIKYEDYARNLLNLKNEGRLQ